MSMDFARQEGITVFSFENMCKMYSGIVTVTAGGGDVTIDLPFDWTGGHVTTVTEYNSTLWAAGQRFSSYDAVTNATYTGAQSIYTYNGDAVGVVSKTANSEGVVKSATTTSFTINDNGTTCYVKYFVYAPYSKTITAGNRDIVSTSGTVAPTSTPDYVGQQYVNTTDGSIYVAVGTNGSYNWGLVGKGATTVFDVDTVSNMFAWWDASENITYDSGNIVTTWVDKVNGWSLTKEGSPEYVSSWKNSKPAVYFDGVDDDLYLDHTETGTSWTVFLVASVDDTYTDIKVLSYNASQTEIGVSRNPSQFFMGESTNTPLGTYTVGNPYLLTERATGSAGTLYGSVNGGADVSIQTSYTEAVDATILGGYWGTHAHNIKCHIAEHIIYNASLSAENIAIVKAYLNNKYAIY